MSSFAPSAACTSARRVAAVCRGSEASRIQQHLISILPDSAQVDVLWLTWVQWRALGREAMSRDTELSPWVIADRLRQLREAGIAILSWSEETDLLARGRFHVD
ncbi:MAG: hypothetical protein ACRYFS_00475 [Janthinobacterium lividum]